MERREWIKILEQNGWYILREGHDHTIYTDGQHNEPVSRQKEISDLLIKRIMKRRGIE